MGTTGWDPRWMALQNMLPNNYNGTNWMGMGNGNGQSIDPAHLLQLLGLPLHHHQRRRRPMHHGFLEDLLGGNHHHNPHLDVDVNLYHHPRHRHGGHQHFRPDPYYLSDDTDYDSDTDDDRSYVRRRPRRHHHHRHPLRRWRSWSPSYADLDGFDNWCLRGPRGRARHRGPYYRLGRPRDGSYTDREFTLR